MKRITYLCVILHVKHKRLPILAAFTRFLILGKGLCNNYQEGGPKTRGGALS